MRYLDSNTPRDEKSSERSKSILTTAFNHAETGFPLGVSFTSPVFQQRSSGDRERVLSTTRLFDDSQEPLCSFCEI
ncbi:hypothetical protein KU43_06800 [Mesotoga sp. SC_NapDC2]|nr:hypothetical protein V512_001765 [Mesotoga sp. Brook.08.105.5.1]PXF33439.1 hypothetical protein EU77_13670 [Mesotoga sp. SC_NapDC]RIZ60775.1 hypothetical protein KU43_06800 [Mesotoga sp. SC_NapDC2]